MNRPLYAVGDVVAARNMRSRVLKVEREGSRWRYNVVPLHALDTAWQSYPEADLRPVDEPAPEPAWNRTPSPSNVWKTP